MNQYRESPILRQASARLVPPNHNYPDADCLLLLTETGFYALEDCYDGTFTEHFAIPLRHLSAMEAVYYDGVHDVASPSTNSPLHYLGTALLELVGSRMTVKGSEVRATARNRHLKVTHNGGAVYFRDFTGDLRRFVDVYEKLAREG